MSADNPQEYTAGVSRAREHSLSCGPEQSLTRASKPNKDWLLISPGMAILFWSLKMGPSSQFQSCTKAPTEPFEREAIQFEEICLRHANICNLNLKHPGTVC